MSSEISSQPGALHHAIFNLARISVKSLQGLLRVISTQTAGLQGRLQVHWNNLQLNMGFCGRARKQLGYYLAGDLWVTLLTP